MFNFFSKPIKAKPESADCSVVRLSQYLEELCPILSRGEISEIYIHGAEEEGGAVDCSRTSWVTLLWSSAKLASFIAELSWESRVRIDPFRPFAGGVLPGLPWRWHAIIAPMSPGSPLVVLRRQKFDVLDLTNFQFKNTSADELVQKLAQNISVVIFGATYSGKTTLLMSLLKHYFADVRLGIAEAVEEIPLLSNRWFRMVEVPSDVGGRGGVSMNQVLSEMMRLSPKAIVIGEMRGGEAQFLADAARTGHGGIMTTFHAGGFDDARTRLVHLTGISLNQLPPIFGVHVTTNGRLFSVRADMLN